MSSSRMQLEMLESTWDAPVILLIILFLQVKRRGGGCLFFKTGKGTSLAFFLLYNLNPPPSLSHRTLHVVKVRQSNLWLLFVSIIFFRPFSLSLSFLYPFPPSFFLLGIMPVWPFYNLAYSPARSPRISLPHPRCWMNTSELPPCCFCAFSLSFPLPFVFLPPFFFFYCHRKYKIKQLRQAENRVIPGTLSLTCIAFLIHHSQFSLALFSFFQTNTHARVHTIRMRNSSLPLHPFLVLCAIGPHKEVLRFPHGLWIAVFSSPHYSLTNLSLKPISIFHTSVLTAFTRIMKGGKKRTHFV